MINYFDKQIRHPRAQQSAPGSGRVLAAGESWEMSYLGQQHGQSHDVVLCQFVFIVYLGLPLLRRQHLDKQTQKPEVKRLLGCKNRRETAVKQ